MRNMIYREITPAEANGDLLNDFVRRQEVTKVWRKTGGAWHIVELSFIDDWDACDREKVVSKIGAVSRAGGRAFGAFSGNRLTGFAVVENKRFGARGQYAELSLLHVSEDFRGSGLGRKLFSLAADFARARGEEKLYISAHSAVETQAFYRAMGCEEASEYSREHVLREPCDCQLEYVL